jgi:transposase
MLPSMEAKRPFSDQDWQGTPEPVQQYFRQLEQTIALLADKVKQLENRTEKLESKTNQNSQNSSKPPSTDSPFNK